MKLFQKFLPILPFLFVFLYSLYVPTDPDLGWHLKNGEYFFQHGQILRDNLYATLMPDYKWANTSWLTDILTYGIYAIAGFAGLTVLAGLVVAATFYFFSRVANLTLWDQVFLFPLILYLLQPVNSVSLRGRQLTFLFIGILFFFLSKYPKQKKFLYFVIPLFLLWANVHGQFILGLGLFGLWVLLSIIKLVIDPNAQGPMPKKLKTVFRSLPSLFKKHFHEIRLLIGVLLTSLLVTFINPFGWGIHSAALSHVNSPLLQNIAEYLPFELLSTGWWNQIMAGVLLAFGFLALLLRNKFMNQLPLLGAGIALFLLSFEVRRYAWPAYYLILPLLSPLTSYLKPDSKKMTYYLSSFFAVVLVIMAIVAKYPLTQFSNYSWDTYCQQTKCSPQAVAYMKQSNLTENVFTMYGWGGWLIWEYPEIKPVIDGRMHLWNQNGYSGFEEYYAIEQNFKDIDRTEYNTVLIAPDKPVHDRLIKLENAGKWKMVYNDENASVFVRN